MSACVLYLISQTGTRYVLLSTNAFFIPFRKRKNEYNNNNKKKSVREQRIIVVKFKFYLFFFGMKKKCTMNYTGGK